jgi:hypothetical protein
MRHFRITPYTDTTRRSGAALGRLHRHPMRFRLQVIHDPFNAGIGTCQEWVVQFQGEVKSGPRVDHEYYESVH